MRAGDISAARCNAATTIWLKHPARRSDHPRLRSSKTLSLLRRLQALNSTNSPLSISMPGRDARGAALITRSSTRGSIIEDRTPFL